MRILFELLLFIVLVFFFGAIALIFYKWLSKKFLDSGQTTAPCQETAVKPSDENKEDQHG